MHASRRYEKRDVAMLDIDKELLMVWSGQIRNDFEKKLIKTEGDLLCSWYHHLRPLVEDRNLKIQCQTRKFKEIGIPDIFLWDEDGNPLVVMELKIHPSPPKWRKRGQKRTDFEKLWLFSLSERPPRRGYFCMIIPTGVIAYRDVDRSHRETYDFQPREYFREFIGKGSQITGEVEYWDTGGNLKPLRETPRFPPFLDSEGYTEEDWESYKKGFKDLDFSYRIKED